MGFLSGSFKEKFCLHNKPCKHFFEKQITTYIFFEFEVIGIGHMDNNKKSIYHSFIKANWVLIIETSNNLCLKDTKSVQE